MTKNKLQPIALLLLSMFVVGITQAQESTNAAGGNALSIGGSIAYSIGQIAYTTNISTSGTISQGVHQPYEIFIVGIKETISDFSLTMFPNPASQNVSLQIHEYNNEKLSYQIYNMIGELLNEDQIINAQTQINIRSLPPGTYFVNIVNQEHINVQSFKLIKT